MSFRGQKKPFTAEEISAKQRCAEHLEKLYAQMDLRAQEAVEEALQIIYGEKEPPPAQEDD